jgi:hypothetical protein
MTGSIFLILRKLSYFQHLIKELKDPRFDVLAVVNIKITIFWDVSFLPWRWRHWNPSTVLHGITPQGPDIWANSDSVCVCKWETKRGTHTHLHHYPELQNLAEMSDVYFLPYRMTTAVHPLELYSIFINLIKCGYEVLVTFLAQLLN